MRWVTTAIQATVTALAGLLIDDVLLVLGTGGALALTWALRSAGWVPAGALGFVLLAAIVATLAASLRRALAGCSAHGGP